MPLTGHLELSDFIKGVHEELREKSKLIGSEKAWQEHCADTAKLQKYATFMKELATNHWEKTNEDNSSDLSRISWIYKACVDYFNKDIYSIRNKESDIACKINKNTENIYSDISKKFKLLDVGSCYNPFKLFDSFEVTAIDIAPALKEVLKCDFLNVNLGKTLEFENNHIQTLPENNFHIVVFSLLLEYFPNPIQRKLCCEKAYSLLKPEGVLLIITPDSNHVGSNAKYMKSWRFVLSEMGFSRIKYEKLKHIHCMVFRKTVIKEIPLRWADIHRKEQVFDNIYIPQDFKQKSEKTVNYIELSTDDLMVLNEELPFSDVLK